MSDEDYDIFSLPPKRATAASQKLFVQELNPEKEEIKEDYKEMEEDYDFIKVNAALKKPTKLNKVKQTGKSKGQNMHADVEEPNNNVQAEVACKSNEAKASPTRDLSPVSQLIYEMEQKKVRDMPIARRTRSSLGKREATPIETTVAAAKPNSPPKHAARGRKKAAAAPSSVAVSVNTAIVDQPPSNVAVSVNEAIVNPTLGIRQQVAEYAARLGVSDTIDLVSAVMPRVEGFVNLDPDDEAPIASPLKETAAQKTDNFDDDNPIVYINLNWLGEIQVYKLRQYQKFSHMFKDVSERNSVPLEHIVINMDEHFIQPTESPATVGLKVYHILSGCAIESNNAKADRKDYANPYMKRNKFQLKVQGDKWKRPLIIPMKKTESFKMLYIKCSEELNCDTHDFKLFFDGELLDPEDTPRNQDMEGDEIIDLRMK